MGNIYLKGSNGDIPGNARVREVEVYWASCHQILSLAEWRRQICKKKGLYAQRKQGKPEGTLPKGSFLRTRCCGPVNLIFFIIIKDVPKLSKDHQRFFSSFHPHRTQSKLKPLRQFLARRSNNLCWKIIENNNRSLKKFEPRIKVWISKCKI
jgi:hypothetical protein